MENLINGLEQIEFQANAISNLLEKGKLNWEVKKQVLYREGVNEQGEKVLVDSGWFQPVHGETGKVMSRPVTNDFEIFQNLELVELGVELAKAFDLEVARAGSFKGGNFTWVQIPTEEIVGIGENNDVVKKWITITNSHQFGTALSFGTGTQVISCMNTFNAAKRALSNSIAHTKNFRVKLDIAKADFEKYLKVQRELVEKFRRMAETACDPFTAAEIGKVALKIQGYTMNENEQKKVDAMLAAIESEMAEKGQTVWGAFNGVTYYTQHVMKAQNVEAAKAIGAPAEIDMRAFNMAMSLLEVDYQ